MNSFQQKVALNILTPQRFMMRQPIQVSQLLDQPQQQNQKLTLEEFNQLDKRLYAASTLVENFRVNNWTKNFLYRPVSAEGLTSIFLNENSLFQEMRTMIDKYNEEIRKAENSGSDVRNAPWRAVFYQQLLNLMREIVSTKDRDVQNQFIEKVYNWASDQISKLDYQGKNLDMEIISETTRTRPNTGITRPETAITRFKQNDSRLRPFSSNERRPFSGINNISKSGQRPISGYPMMGSQLQNILQTGQQDTIAEITLNMSFDNRPESGQPRDLSTIQETNEIKDVQHKQPSDMINDQQLDYVSGARTKHETHDMPQVRIQTFKRRLISSVDPAKQGKPPLPELQSTFPTNYINHMNQYHKQNETPEYQGELPTIENQDGGTQKTEGKVAETIVEAKPKAIVKFDKKDKVINMEPRLKLFKNDKQSADDMRVNLNKEFEAKSNYMYYQPSMDPREMNLQKQYEQQKNYDTAQRREDQEMLFMMKEWSQAKSRIDREIGRRIESAKFGNEYPKNQIEPINNNKASDQKELDKFLRVHKRVMGRSLEPAKEDLSLDDLSCEEEIVYEEQNEDDNSVMKMKKRPQTSVQTRIIDVSKQIPNTAKAPRFTTNANPHELEFQMNQKKIEIVKKMHGDLISLTEKSSTQFREVPTTSLSIYAQQQINQKFFFFFVRPDKLKPTYRPFSAVLETCSEDKFRQEQLDEIFAVKQRLAQHKINIPVQKLISGLLIPDQADTVMKIGVTNLPNVGQGIMDDGKKAKKKKSSSKRISKKKSRK